MITYCAFRGPRLKHKDMSQSRRVNSNVLINDDDDDDAYHNDDDR